MEKITGRQNLKKKLLVDPVRNIKDIKAISQLLESHPRNYLLWTIGINNGLRISDLIKLKYCQVKDLKVGDTLKVIESKTKKENFLVINKSVHKAIVKFVKAIDPKDEDYLFASRKSDHLTSMAVGKMIKLWCNTVNLKGHFGSHTLRKTWGYHSRVTHGVSFEVICKRYLHSNPNVTMRYLGIEDKEVVKILMNEIG